MDLRFLTLCLVLLIPTAVRADDGTTTTLSTGDLNDVHVSRTGEAVPDHSTRMAWTLGTATFVGGWAIYFTAEDVDGDGNGWSAFAEGLQQSIGTFVVFAGTPLMAGFGWFIGSVAENGEWRRARFDDDTARRHDALRRRLALDRARNTPPRPFGPSISTSF